MFYQKTILLHHLLLFQLLGLIINGSIKDEWFVESYETGVDGKNTSFE